MKYLHPVLRGGEEPFLSKLKGGEQIFNVILRGGDEIFVPLTEVLPHT